MIVTRNTRRGFFTAARDRDDGPRRQSETASRFTATTCVGLPTSVLIGKTVAVGATSTATEYAYDGNQIVLDFNDGDLAHRYLWGPQVDQLLAQENVGDGVLWMLTDNENTVRDVLDNSGTLVNHLSYDSFGNVTSGDTSVTNFLYTGRFYDAETGLQNNWHRWYDASIGKWISEDPMGFNAGDADLNRYAGNDPLMWTDPSGLTETEQELIGTYPEYWNIDEAGKTATLQLNINVQFAGDWTDARKSAFIARAKQAIEDYFNKQGAVLKQSSSGGKCQSFKPRVKLNVSENMENPEQKWIVTSNPQANNKIISSTSSGLVSRLQLNEQDAVPVTYKGYTQTSVVHEFGHAIGLDHPGGKTDEYENDKLGLMGRGMEFRDSYLAPWVKALENKHPECGEYKIGY